MGVNPGFGGQKFIENTLKKVVRLKHLIETSQSHALIEVDGGVSAATAPLLINAGVNILVSGSFIFRNSDPIGTIHNLKALKPDTEKEF
jgi:ribulose-phosphate 3-epimerase